MKCFILEFEFTRLNDQHCLPLSPSKVIKETTKDNLTLPMIDLFLNESKREDLKQVEEVLKDVMNANFPVEEIGKNFSSLFNLLWHSSLPCHSAEDSPGSEHLLKRCLLYGQEVDCANLFKPVPTDMGICCSFNHKNVLRDSEFLQLLKRKQKIFNRTGNDDDGTYLAEIGRGRGLQVFVDQHSNRVTAGSILSTSK